MQNDSKAIQYQRRIEFRRENKNGKEVMKICRCQLLKTRQSLLPDKGSISCVAA